MRPSSGALSLGRSFWPPTRHIRLAYFRSLQRELDLAVVLVYDVSRANIGPTHRT